MHHLLGIFFSAVLIMTLVTIVLIPLHQREVDKRRNGVARKKKYVGELKQTSGRYEAVSSQRPSGRHEVATAKRPSGRHGGVASKRPSERLAVAGKKKPSGRHLAVSNKRPSGRHHVVALKKAEDEITIIPPQLSEMSVDGGLPWKHAMSRYGNEF